MQQYATHCNKQCHYLYGQFVLFSTGSAAVQRHIIDTYQYTALGKLWRWRSWLRHCATNRKFVGLIPEFVIGNFY